MTRWRSITSGALPAWVKRGDEFAYKEHVPRTTLKVLPPTLLPPWAISVIRMPIGRSLPSASALEDPTPGIRPPPGTVSPVPSGPMGTRYDRRGQWKK